MAQPPEHSSHHVTRHPVFASGDVPDHSQQLLRPGELLKVAVGAGAAGGSGPGPLSLMAKRAGRGLGRLRKNRKRRKGKERRNGRMRWFGKRRGKNGGNQQSRDHRAETLETRRRKPRMGWFPVVALAVLMAAVVAVPQSALADGHEDGGWSSDEIEFQPPQPVEGRRPWWARRCSTSWTP